MRAARVRRTRASSLEFYTLQAASKAAGKVEDLEVASGGRRINVEGALQKAGFSGGSQGNPKRQCPYET